MKRLFAESDSGAGDPSHRRQVANAMTAELVRHSVAEEQYLYPLARQVLAGGDDLADHEISQHAEVEELLKRLEPVPATDPSFDRTVREVAAAVLGHIDEEESDLFPRLREACAEDELLVLGRKVSEAKRIAPTRAHPSAPHTPPKNKVLAPGAGLVDRVRDAFSHRATEPDEVL